MAPPPPSKRSTILTLFLPRRHYLITPLLIAANVLVFIIMVASGVSVIEPSTTDLLNWGGNLRALTLDGQWWRLFTCMFLHGGIIHLAFNMYALLYIGILLEPRLGSFRFGFGYLCTGIVSSMASAFWHEATVSVGASGAIFGLYGIFLALLTTNYIEKAVRGPLLSVAACYGLYHSTSMDFLTFRRKMEDFSRNENRALAVYKLPDTTSNQAFLAAIQDSGIASWNENLRLLAGVRKLKLPDEYKKRTQLLIDYCNARLDAYQYWYRRSSGAATGQDSSGYYNEKVTNIITATKKEE